MGRPMVLLMDSSNADSGWVAEAQEFCTLQRVTSEEQLDTRIKLLCPHVLCFEFGDYDPAGLALLARTKQAYPSLPILMITEDHSESLAVWALRARVWDYFVKPVTIEELRWAIMVLYGAATEARSQSSRRRMVRPRAGNRAGTPSDGRTRVEVAVDKARAYIERHLSEKLSGEELAARCSMSYFHFSRTFRCVAGMTVRDYILHERIRKAAQLLREPGSSITKVCFEVGFHDLSHFARMFRRYKGSSPSDYRHHGGKGAQPASEANAEHVVLRLPARATRR